jgi:hypothetical protein
MKQSQLLAPFSESHLGFRDEKALHGALTCPTILAVFVPRRLLSRVGEYRPGDANGSAVRGLRQLQRDRIGPCQLIGDNFDDASLVRNSIVQSRKTAGMQKQLLQKRRNIDDKASGRETSHKLGTEIQSSHRDCADIATECGIPAGIQTARNGGTTQTPCFV